MGNRRRFRRAVSRQRVNPYFRKKTGRKVSFGAVFFVFVILIGLVGGWFFVFSDYFRISDIVVSGGTDEMNEEIKNRLSEDLFSPLLFVFPRNHSFFISGDSVRRDLLDNLPLDTVEISMSRSVIRVSVTEKIRTFYLLKDDILYAVDRVGRVIGRVDDMDRIRIELNIEKGDGPPIIEDFRDNELGDGSVALPAAWLEDIVKLFDKIQSRTMLTPLSARLVDSEGRIDLPTESGVVLYLTLSRPVDDQLDKLDALINRKLVDITELSYIDLRFTNRLFYH